MELKEFIDSIRVGCDFIEQDGYVLRKVDSSINRNFWYEKHTDTEGFRISFGWTQYGDEFHVKGLDCLKRFNNVEQEIQKVLGGNLIDYYTVHKSPSIDYIPKELTFDTTKNNIHFVLRNQNDVKLFVNFVKRFYLETVIAFYDQFEHFSEVIKEYSLLDRDKVSALILNTGNDIFYRELVIKHKSNSNDLNDFTRMVIGELEPMKNNSTFSKILENFKLINLNLQQTS